MDENKTFDVSRPGQTPVDATARPIITSRAILKDPMVSGAVTDTANAQPAPSNTSANQPATAMPAVPQKPAPALDVDAAHAAAHPEPIAAGTTIQPQPTVPVTTAPIAPPAASQSTSTVQPQPPSTNQPTTPETKTETSDAAAVDAVADEVTKKAQAQESAEDKTRREALQKLIASKQYYIAVQPPKRRRFIWVMVIGLILIGAAAVVFLIAR